jgi:hypothetical protein
MNCGRAPAAVYALLCRSYWISLAGAGQLPLWLLDARSKIKAAMSKAMYGEVRFTRAPKCCGYFLQPYSDCCLSAAAQRIARVLEVFCSRHAGPRGSDPAPHDECVRKRVVFVSAKRMTSVVGGVTVCPVRHAVHVGSGMSSEHVQVPLLPAAPA